MNSTAPNRQQKDNSNQRSRKNNPRNNRQEWVPRASLPVLAAQLPPIGVESSFQNEDGSGGEAVDRPSMHSSGPNHALPRRSQTRSSVKLEEKGNYNRRIPAKVLNGVSIPQLVQEIQDKLLKGAVECMICYDMVQRSSPIWSCSSCYSIFHLSCTKKWARAPTSVDLLVEKNQGSNWRCPGCQNVQLISAKEIRYVCFCGKRPDPPSDLYLTPHSCGEPCGKALERELPADGMTSEYMCPHLCVLQCHPGPCPPCTAFAPPRSCPCGKKVIATRCSDRRSALTCGQICDRILDCGRHSCKKACHIGSCDPCEILIDASCFCKKNIETVPCGDIPVKGEIESESGVFSCSSICQKKLDCGNHFCLALCHPGPCGKCDLSPSMIKSCCCGKTPLKEDRKSCLDPIPTCSQNCGKILPCGFHCCSEKCHSGDCPPCHVLVTQKCRCGSASRTVECFRTVSETEKFTCDKPCGQKKSCGRHRCSDRCCPLSHPSNSSSLDWDPHLCSMPCEKKLRCGQHSCRSLCHSGHCPPCMETIFTDLSCACGRTSIPPPLPCGTAPPSCQLPCLLPQPCGHPSSHSCHFGNCPTCSVPISKECVGGHVVLRNIPCGSKDIRCNQSCRKTRQCGLHSCTRACHPPPCDSSQETSSSRSSCGQTCGAPRRECRHSCTSLCHPSTPCPDERCEIPVTITCSCGRMTASVPCDIGGSSNGYNGDTIREASIIHKLPVSLQPMEGNNGQRMPLSQRKLMCDDECLKMERKKVLADAFGVSNPNLDALHFGDDASSSLSEALSDLLKRDTKWVLSVEERCKYLLLGRSRGITTSAVKVHVFCVMSKEKRDAVRLIVERWKLSVSSAGWEPKRFLVVHVAQKSKAPSRVLLGTKSPNPTATLQPPAFDPSVDMDPRLVVALFDMPRDSDVSALVLRFGGECELVWLNDKNALAVFSDPARASTAMRRLDQGSVYHGAAAFVPQKSGPPPSSVAGASSAAWGGSSTVAASASAPSKGWKTAISKSGLEEWSSNRWSTLSQAGGGISSERRAADPSSDESGNNPPILSRDNTVVDDWEKAYE
ncbi:hypothetical protein M569_05241 [Genlisea aurea]|uniref:NF-X1-type zinc finger protein NFXL1 n=1 Tax=Genlisea aurea TaxID=192259 RepID=S8E1J1_9LAMI|nr:hypothetical protein M569_05241 [Genlisea aurea]